jgi:2'-hydroxyisoflavone reductase
MAIFKSYPAGRWDAVIDTCGYVPRVVRASAELLRRCRASLHLHFLCSPSTATSTKPASTKAPVATIDDETTGEVTGATYGALKALCEQAVIEEYPDASLIIRPGLIVGPYDPPDRFTYWPVRVDRGGEVLAPGTPENLVQIVDARDLAEWTIAMVEEGTTGIYNATGPDDTAIVSLRYWRHVSLLPAAIPPSPG